MNSFTVYWISAISIPLAATLANAQDVAVNTGSLGEVANGTHARGVETGLPGLLNDPNDQSVGYPNPETGGNGPYQTTLEFLPELNPPAGQPFTIEYLAEPWTDANFGAGPAPLFNRVGVGNRSGWVFFQRTPTVGWNFAMYSGQGSAIGINLTGGTSEPFETHHIVAVYDGSSAFLYHNGVLVDSGSGPYAANTDDVIFSVAGYSADDPGDNSYRGIIDEVAFYDVALTAGQVAAHYSAVHSDVPGAYSSLVIADGALLYWQNLPECAPGDLDCDGTVDVFDLLILLGAWGECADVEDCPADLNGDGVVNVFDLLILLSHWG